MDGKWKHQRLHQEGPAYKPHRTCTFSFDLSAALPMNRSVGWCCEWVEVHARPPCSSRRSERGARFRRIKCLGISYSSPKANILINKDQRACLADFGLSTITGVATYAGASRASLISNDSLMSFTEGGTRRWMSPELLDPERFGMPESEDNRPTGQSDCYALGMVIYEVGFCAITFVAVDR